MTHSTSDARRWWRSVTALGAAVTIAVSLAACTPSPDDPPVDAESVSENEGERPGDAADDNSVNDDESESSDSDSSSSSSGSSGGSSSSGSSGGSNSGSGAQQPASPAPSASSSASPAAPAPSSAEVTLAITSQRCTSGKLIVAVTANYDNSTRKGIESVTFERQNEFNAWLDFDGTWLGPQTGQANVWNGSLAGNQQNIGKTLRVTAESVDGETKVITAPITAPC